MRLATPDGAREEELDLSELLAGLLGSGGHGVERHDGWLSHPESGFSILAQLASLDATSDGGAQTVTTVQVNHPRLLPKGAFEFQHSTGDSVRESVERGFDAWLKGDFVPLLDALREEASDCQTMVLEFPADGAGPARRRRAVLGPTWHYAQRPVQAAESSNDDGEHDFCPCCLLTHSFEAFGDLLKGDETYCLRLYAARQGDAPGADCRVNGDEYEHGAQALRRYVETWPDAGFEFRKQYVVIHTV